MIRRIALLWGLAFVLMVQSIVYAVPHNWQWIESDDEFGYFVDMANITKTTNFNGKVREAELWLKMKYTAKSAKDVLEDFDHSYINADLLADDGAGIFKIKLDFLRGSVHVLSSSFLDKSGNVLVTDTDAFYQYVDVQSFYRPVFTYVENHLAGTNSYSIYKDKKARPCVNAKNVDGNKEYTVVNLWRAHYLNNDESKSVVPVSVYTYDANMENVRTYCTDWCYDFKNNTYNITAVIQRNSNDEWAYYDLADNGEVSKPTAIVPDTIGEAIKKQLMSFATGHKKLLHRLDGDGLTVER
jgi:hypothetical protein